MGTGRSAIALVSGLGYCLDMQENKATGSGLEQKIKDFESFLEAQKALDPLTFRLTAANAIADAFIIVTATSRRHAQGLAEGILSVCRENGHQFLNMEGFDTGQWILVDCNDVIVHIFQQDSRDLYRLEDLCRHGAKETEQ